MHLCQMALHLFHANRPCKLKWISMEAVTRDLLRSPAQRWVSWGTGWFRSPATRASRGTGWFRWPASLSGRGTGWPLRYVWSIHERFLRFLHWIVIGSSLALRMNLCRCEHKRGVVQYGVELGPQRQRRAWTGRDAQDRPAWPEKKAMGAEKTTQTLSTMTPTSSSRRPSRLPSLETLAHTYIAMHTYPWYRPLAASCLRRPRR